MRSRKDYIPANDTEFYFWATNLYTYAAKHYERWGIMALPTTAIDGLTTFKGLVDTCALPTRNKMDTLAKNECRAELEKGFRNYVQGVIARNVNVTNEDRLAMRINIRDTKPTPAGPPLGQAQASISYPGQAQLMLHISHVEGTPYNARANFGYNIRYKLFPQGHPKPVEPEELTETSFARRKKVEFSFHAADSGKIAYFCIRYENSRGEPGAWGPIISAIIP